MSSLFASFHEAVEGWTEIAEVGDRHASLAPEGKQPSSPKASTEPAASDDDSPSRSLAAGSLPARSQTGAQSSIGQPKIVAGRGRGPHRGRPRGGLKIARE